MSVDGVASLGQRHELAPTPGSYGGADTVLEIVTIAFSGLSVGCHELYSNHIKMVRYSNVIDWQVFLGERTFPPP